MAMSTSLLFIYSIVVNKMSTNNDEYNSESEYESDSEQSDTEQSDTEQEIGFVSKKKMSYVLARKNADLNEAELKYKREYRRNVNKKIKESDDPMGKKRVKKGKSKKTLVKYYLRYLIKNYKYIIEDDEDTDEYELMTDRLDLLYSLINDKDRAKEILEKWEGIPE